MKWLLVLFAAFAFTASAADVNGKWTGKIDTPNGTMDVVFNLKADGNTLTGTTVSFQGQEQQISEGKVDGDNLSWTVVNKFQDFEFKIGYKGKVSGSEMKVQMTFTMGDGNSQSMDMVLKKA
jgi:hypothetical protein